MALCPGSLRGLEWGDLGRSHHGLAGWLTGDGLARGLSWGKVHRLQQGD